MNDNVIGVLIPFTTFGSALPLLLLFWFYGESPKRLWCVLRYKMRFPLNIILIAIIYPIVGALHIWALPAAIVIGIGWLIHKYAINHNVQCGIKGKIGQPCRKGEE